MSTGLSSGICPISVDRFRRERVQPLGAGVGADTQPLDHHAEAERARMTAHEPDSEWHPQPLARLAAGPVPPAQQHHVQIKHGGGQRDEVEETRERDRPRCRNRGTAPAPTSPRSAAGAAAGRRADPVQEDRHGAEEGAQDERHRDVRRQQRRHHPHRDQHRAHQPVAQVGREHHPEVGRAQEPAGPPGG